jgi:membrane-associated phospholipid phosphatase
VILVGGKARHWILGIIFPLLMSIAVVATGNHFVLDVVAGAALAFGAWYLVPRITTVIRERILAGQPTAQASGVAN